MGVRPFIIRAQGTNPFDVFNELKQKSIVEYGNRKRSGHIGDTDWASDEPAMTFDRYLKYNDNKAIALITEMDHGEVGFTHFIDLGILHYKINRLFRTVLPYTAVYRQRYAITDMEGKVLEPQIDHIFELKGPADNKAAKIALGGTPVKVRKLMARLSVEDTVIEFKVETKIQKTPPKIQTGPFCTVEEVHQYIFFGNART